MKPDWMLVAVIVVGLLNLQVMRSGSRVIETKPGPYFAMWLITCLVGTVLGIVLTLFLG